MKDSKDVTGDERSQIISGVTRTTNKDDGNVKSVLSFTVSSQNDGKFFECDVKYGSDVNGWENTYTSDPANIIMNS